MKKIKLILVFQFLAVVAFGQQNDSNTKAAYEKWLNNYLGTWVAESDEYEFELNLTDTAVVKSGKTWLLVRGYYCFKNSKTLEEICNENESLVSGPQPVYDKNLGINVKFPNGEVLFKSVKHSELDTNSTSIRLDGYPATAVSLKLIDAKTLEWKKLGFDSIELKDNSGNYSRYPLPENMRLFKQD